MTQFCAKLICCGHKLLFTSRVVMDDLALNCDSTNKCTDEKLINELINVLRFTVTPVRQNYFKFTSYPNNYTVRFELMQQKAFFMSIWI